MRSSFPRTRFAAVALAAGCLATAPSAATPAAAQSTAPAPAAPTFGDDVQLGIGLVGRGLTGPLRWTARQWLTIPAGIAVLGVVSVLDDDIERFAEGQQNPAGDGYFGAIEPFGEQYSLAVVLGIYGAGWAFDRPALRRTAVEASAASVVAGGIVTPALKVLAGRTRPREEVGQYDFNPFSDNNASFPSGHTTQAFAVASVIAAEADILWVDILAYGLAASVAGARIYHDAHFLTDTLAGAAIGITVGRSMVAGGRVLEPEITRARGTDGEGVRVGFRVRF